MAIMNIFKTTTTEASPLDASGGSPAKAPVSDFLTVQSFANFAAMTGAITAAWHALQQLTPYASSLWVPYAFAFAWAVVSILISMNGLKTPGSDTVDTGTVLGAIFVAFINALVLAGAVIGTSVATSPP
jgi:hypothetical protein